MEHALALDPSYGLAWAGIADAFCVLGYYGQVRPEDGAARAREALRRHDPQFVVYAQGWPQSRFLRALPEWDGLVATRGAPT